MLLYWSVGCAQGFTRTSIAPSDLALVTPPAFSRPLLHQPHQLPFLLAQPACLHLPAFALATSPAWNVLPLFSFQPLLKNFLREAFPDHPMKKLQSASNPNLFSCFTFPITVPHLTHYRLCWFILLIAPWLTRINASGMQDFFSCFSLLLNLWLIELCLAYTDSVHKCWIDKWMNG